MSLESWKEWVIGRRQEYSVRLNAAHRTKEKESLSLQGEMKGRPSLPTTAVVECRVEKSENGHNLNWPTVKARDWKDTLGCKLDAVNPDGTHRNRRDRLVGAIAEELLGPHSRENPSTNGKNPVLSSDWVEQLMGLPVGWTQLPTEWIG